MAKLTKRELRDIEAARTKLAAAATFLMYIGDKYRREGTDIGDGPDSVTLGEIACECWCAGHSAIKLAVRLRDGVLPEARNMTR